MLKRVFSVLGYNKMRVLYIEIIKMEYGLTLFRYLNYY